MKTKLSFLLFGIACVPLLGHADGLDAAVQAKVDAEIKVIESWAKDPVMIQAVKSHNSSPSAEVVSMTQDKWKSLSVLDPVVRSYTKNPTAELLKAHRSEAVTEAFVSGADGNKVAFLTKTTSWCHLGKPKHDAPMKGKNWQGAAETDESTGLQQVQVAVPVMDADKPIGSLVVGLSLVRLGKK